MTANIQQISIGTAPSATIVFTDVPTSADQGVFFAIEGTTSSGDGNNVETVLAYQNMTEPSSGWTSALFAAGDLFLASGTADNGGVDCYMWARDTVSGAVNVTPAIPVNIVPNALSFTPDWAENWVLDDTGRRSFTVSGMVAPIDHTVQVAVGSSSTVAPTTGWVAATVDVSSGDFTAPIDLTTNPNAGGTFYIWAEDTVTNLTFVQVANPIVIFPNAIFDITWPPAQQPGSWDYAAGTSTAQCLFTLAPGYTTPTLPVMGVSLNSGGTSAVSAGSPRVLNTNGDGSINYDSFGTTFPIGAPFNTGGNETMWPVLSIVSNGGRTPNYVSPTSIKVIGPVIDGFSFDPPNSGPYSNGETVRAGARVTPGQALPAPPDPSDEIRGGFNRLSTTPASLTGSSIYTGGAGSGTDFYNIQDVVDGTVPGINYAWLFNKNNGAGLSNKVMLANP